jgi:hypothetical protein
MEFEAVWTSQILSIPGHHCFWFIFQYIYTVFPNVSISSITSYVIMSLFIAFITKENIAFATPSNLRLLSHLTVELLILIT